MAPSNSHAATRQIARNLWLEIGIKLFGLEKLQADQSRAPDIKVNECRWTQRPPPSSNRLVCRAARHLARVAAGLLFASATMTIYLPAPWISRAVA